MRTISKREVDQLTVSGAKLKRLTETPKPAPKAPDHSQQLAGLESRTSAVAARAEEIVKATAAELSQQRRVIEHLGSQLHALKDELANRGHVPQMTVRRNRHTGFIDTVSVGRLTFSFNRSRVGSVESIDILTPD